MLVIFVKFLADWYLLRGQFILLTWSSGERLGNMGKTLDGHFNYIHLSVFTYERRTAIKVGRVTYNVLWIKDCKSVAELRNNENARRRRNSFSFIQ